MHCESFNREISPQSWRPADSSLAAQEGDWSATWLQQTQRMLTDPERSICGIQCCCPDVRIRMEMLFPYCPFRNEAGWLVLSKLDGPRPSQTLEPRHLSREQQFNAVCSLHQREQTSRQPCQLTALHTDGSTRRAEPYGRPSHLVASSRTHQVVLHASNGIERSKYVSERQYIRRVGIAST